MLLRKVLDGATVFVPPLRPGPAMNIFVATPVRNRAQEVAAIFVLMLDPYADFSRLCQAGRMGRTGETYAIDLAGRMLSASRFEEDLRRLGLLQADQSSVLSLRVADPGGDLHTGFRPSLPRAEQPLTRSAAAVVDRLSGYDASGYRDYRGQTVLGAWAWDQHLGVGLITEMDQEEALATFRASRTIVLGVLAITVLLSILLTGFALWSGERARQTLEQARDDWERVAEERTFDLRESEEQFRTMVGNIPGVVYRCLPHHPWTMLSISDEIEVLSGYPRNGLPGRRSQAHLRRPHACRRRRADCAKHGRGAGEPPLLHQRVPDLRRGRRAPLGPGAGAGDLRRSGTARLPRRRDLRRDGNPAARSRIWQRPRSAAGCCSSPRGRGSSAWTPRGA